ncbi:NADH:ubiquinone oxidoreductase, Na(+)-translocating, C subunit [Chlamydia pneumoniae LPCoLN]|uniref:Na(+)-translocating NADH-quinone reductase subunit C n=1 Tax=Chlamydia pneumoniae TaxID=83558 RepID=UPI0001BD9BC0|nr:Na(+)-translocating NADH-quinone reductase subunit C [Chlamydia pneumoniae]ACZ33407.1 NADH:ubiquinone oxidoreductase, Na(+)-translocating, C subunit [Chlamydia pneumoniae LPCoLN]
MSKGSSKHTVRINQTWYIVSFILGLSLFAGVLLSTIYYVLSPIQEQAATFDRNKQMLLAAHILDFKGRFQIQEKKEWVAATFDKKTQLLEVATKKVSAVSYPELELYAERFVRPLLTDAQGKVFSFEEKNLNPIEFFEKYQKSPPCQQSLLPFYVILENTSRTENMSGADVAKDLSTVQALIFPISGFGLWGPIHGYLGVKNDGDTVLGTAWYQQGETPGLGANITNPEWQEQFYGKKIFLQDSSGTTNFATTDLGLEVIKGSVRTTLGDSPKALSAIDGISGATLTCNGVTEAYVQSLACYRQLLINFSNLTHEKKTGE